MINIPSTIDDPAYRYKMPRMDCKQESRLNGVKTNIFNLEDVAKALRVPGDFIIRYMCAELGVAREKKSIIKGKHTYEELLVVLDKFIDKYLLCPKCKKPETSLFAEKKILKCYCRACGKVNKLDNSHKLTTHIIKDIPKDMSEIETTILDGTEDGPKKSSKKPSKKKKEDEKEEEDPLEEEVEKLTHESEHITHAIENIVEYVKEKGEGLKIEDLKEEIRNQCVSAGAGQDLKYYIAFNSLFSLKILKEFEQFKELFKQYVDADKEDGAKCFLMCTVKFFTERFPKLEIAIPTFLIHVYEAEIIGESIFTKWEAKKFKTDKKSCLYNRKAEKEFKKKAEKFFTWLKEAEEAESEEDEDEEDDK